MGLRYNTLEIIVNCIKQVHSNLSNLAMLELGNQTIHEKHDKRTGKEYFENLGLDHTSIDLNGLDGALIKDLSSLDDFKLWFNKFDIVTNAGTTEHVEPHKRQYEAFLNIHNCCKPNGVMVHILPEVTSHDNSGTWLNHCHYYYDYTFFKFLAKKCNYTILHHSEIDGNIVIGLMKNHSSKFDMTRTELISRIHVRNKNEKVDIMTVVNKNSMVDKSRIEELEQAIVEIYNHNLDGDFVECGTWRGGLAALMIHHIEKYKLGKKLWVYDTFQGMTQPTGVDGENAINSFQATKIENGEYANWCRATLDIVKSTCIQASEDFDDFTKFVVGRVEDTLIIENNLPGKISLLRLDTDWYESTKIELEVLFPRVVPGGVIIIDDYTAWQGSHQAVEEYLQSEIAYKSKKVSPNGSLIILK